MNIAQIHAFPIASPISDWCYVKIQTDDGLTGWGECSLPGSCRAVAAAVAELTPLLMGLSATNTEYAWQRVYRHRFWRGGPVLTAALSGVDMALWDIRARAAGLPVYALLGGAVRKRIRLYANCGLSNDPAVFRDRVRQAVEIGYQAVKIYPLPAVGPVEGPATTRQVVECCQVVRDTLGPDRDFAVDCHGRCTPAVAIMLEAALRDTHPLWIEEPVQAESIEALQVCARRFRTPIAVGERLFTRWAFRPIFEKQLAAIVQPDVANAGGITELAKIASAAELYNCAFNPHNPNGPLQSHASAHLAAWAQSFGMLEHRHTDHDYMQKFCAPIVTVESDGCTSLPPGPGFGVEIDEDFLRRNPAAPWRAESFRSDGSIGDW
jgi:galactonate dehydratase